jgi:hypothetical protein
MMERRELDHDGEAGELGHGEGSKHVKIKKNV